MCSKQQHTLCHPYILRDLIISLIIYIFFLLHARSNKDDRETIVRIHFSRFEKRNFHHIKVIAAFSFDVPKGIFKRWYKISFNQQVERKAIYREVYPPACHRIVFRYVKWGTCGSTNRSDPEKFYFASTYRFHDTVNIISQRWMYFAFEKAKKERERESADISRVTTQGRVKPK